MNSSGTPQPRKEYLGNLAARLVDGVNAYRGRGAVSDGFKTLGNAQIDVGKVRVPHAGPGEVRLGEVRPAEVRPEEVRPAEIRLAEVRPNEVRHAEVSPAEVSRV